MKTLYITDLDGTLLNSKGGVSDKTKEIINRLSDEGLLFSVATSRSILSAVPLLDGIDVTAPIVALSGVVVYDLKNKKTVNFYSIDKKSYYRLIEIFEKHGKSPFSFLKTPILKTKTGISQSKNAFFVKENGVLFFSKCYFTK